MADKYVLVEREAMDFYGLAMPDDDTWHSLEMGDEVHTYTNWEWIAGRFIEAKRRGHLPVVYRLVPIEDYEKDRLMDAVIDTIAEEQRQLGIEEDE